MLILASGSPRRKELLSYLCTPFEVIPSDVDENLKDFKDPVDFARQLAEHKAWSVASRHPNRWVLGCDTIVEKDGQILGKPNNEAEVFEMLGFLSDSTHQVITAFSFIKQQAEIGIEKITDHDTTMVRMGPISAQLVKEYCQTGSPFDKAGAYGIQDPLAARMVVGIKGDYLNVVGLPIYKLYRTIQSHITF